ncbi:RabGAP/TBC [Meredithblackwellia eburnea MCA 4105]
MGGGPKAPSEEDIISDRSSGDAVEVTVNNKKPNFKLPIQSDMGERKGLLGIPTPTDERSGFAFGTAAATEGGDGEEEQQGEERARLLWSKSKVYLHPSSYIRDNIPGFLSIVSLTTSPTRPSTSYLLSWIPESSITGTPDFESYVLVELYASHESEPMLVTLPPASSDHAFSIPIPSLYSLIIQPPTLSSWFGSVTFNLFTPPSSTSTSTSTGTDKVLPPLYFHDEESRSTILDRDRRTEALGILGAQENWSPGSVGGGTSKIPPSWGGEALLSQLRLYAHIVRSQIEPQLFLVNPSREDLEVHSTAIFEDEVVPHEATVGLGLGREPLGAGVREGRELKRTSILHQSLNRPLQGSADYPDEVGPAMDNFTFSVLNSFSRITRGARTAAQQAAQSVLSHPLAKPILKNIPEPIAHFATAPGELTRLQESAGVGSYDAARVYLAKWARVVAEEGERARRREIVFTGPGGREEDSEVGAFEVLASTYSITRPKSTRASATPIVVTEWAAWFDDDGVLMLSEEEARRRIFQRGLADDVRKDVWPFLLKVYPWTSSTTERFQIKVDKTAEYERLRALWHDDPVLQETDVYAEESHRIEIDCRRTDRTHPMFESRTTVPSSEWGESAHPPSNEHVKKTQEVLMTYVFAEQGRDYVQGMSDLLSPLYVVADGDEVLAYWCFVTVMQRMRGNFLRDQSGMKKQLSELQALLALMDPQLHKHLETTGSLNLFFCFRWILCSFKRELSFEATLQLWEVLWTDHLGTHFHLFFALAIIEAHRDIIIRYLREFDEVLKYINELSQTLDVDALLADAEVLYLTFRKVLDASDKTKAEAQDKEGREGSSAGGLRQRKGEKEDDIKTGGVDDDTPEIEESLRELVL